MCFRVAGKSQDEDFRRREGCPWPEEPGLFPTTEAVFIHVSANIPGPDTFMLNSNQTRLLHQLFKHLGVFD